MNPEEFESQLSQFEARLALLFDALACNDANELVAASAGLQSMAVAFSKVLGDAAVGLQGHLPGQLRVRKMAAGLVSVREGLVRRSVGVERGLAALMPAAQDATYAPPSSSTSARRSYGSAGRQSGEFRAVSA
jgi:hypothetical protein